MENAKITFYKIKDCGIYAGINSRKKLASNINDLLPHIKSWISGKGIKLTKTHGVIPGKPLPSYIVDVIKNNQNDWLLILWNEIESTEGAVATVSMDAPVGSPDVEMTDLPENSIPGFATYFWILPDSELIACVRFQHSQNGSYQLSKLIKGFYENFSKYVVYKEDDSNQVKTKIGFQIEDDFHENAHAKFMFDIIKQKGPIKFILNNHKEITKITKRDTIDFDYKNKKAYWQKIIRILGLNGKEAFKTDNKDQVRIEIKSDITHVTEENLNEIINEWQNSNSDNQDYGFKIKGTDYWLSKSFVKDDLYLDVKRHNTEMVDFTELLEELVKHKSNFLKK